jgi:hypothetical protein
MFINDVALIPIEIKHRYSLIQGNSPFSTYQQAKAKTQDSHVEQIFGYMAGNGDEFIEIC